ncbi:MAG: hypothetical protein ABSF84_02710 [Acidimicrobiales bacterium]
MDLIFETDLGAATSLFAIREPSGDIFFVRVGNTASSAMLFIPADDAEALARAILGIADPPPALDWDAVVVRMRADVDEARTFDYSGPRNSEASVAWCPTSAATSAGSTAPTSRPSR